MRDVLFLLLISLVVMIESHWPVGPDDPHRAVARLSHAEDCR